MNNQQVDIEPKKSDYTENRNITKQKQNNIDTHQNDANQKRNSNKYVEKKLRPAGKDISNKSDLFRKPVNLKNEDTITDNQENIKAKSESTSDKLKDDKKNRLKNEVSYLVERLCKNQSKLEITNDRSVKRKLIHERHKLNLKAYTILIKNDIDEETRKKLMTSLDELRERFKKSILTKKEIVSKKLDELFDELARIKDEELFKKILINLYSNNDTESLEIKNIERAIAECRQLRSLAKESSEGELDKRNEKEDKE